MDPVESLAQVAIKHGPLGILAFLCAWYAWRKDREVAELHAKMFDLQGTLLKAYHSLSGELGETLSAALDQLGAGRRRRRTHDVSQD